MRQDELAGSVLKLSDYLQAVQLVVKETFAHTVWVKAELRNVSTKGGHYYFELAEKSDDGNVIASARGNLWRFKAKRVLAKFEKSTGMTLERGLSVLLNVTATMHPLYGFSLTVNDIDPTYTLGDLAKQYAQMREKLDAEGLLEQNKTLPAPFDFEHVLVISPENAAGLGDFQAEADMLAQANACAFHYEHATFQGNHAPSEIRHAIKRGMTHATNKFGKLPDVLVLIRGGGAVGDLAYLNDYELAALLAEQPIPVWTGIGHERDQVILDEVAHTSFDTPSKVIAAIITQLRLTTSQSVKFMHRIETLSKQHLNRASHATEHHLTQMHTQAVMLAKEHQHLAQTHMNQIQQASHRQCQTAHAHVNHALERSQLHATTQLATQKWQARQYLEDTHQHARTLVANCRNRTQHLRQLIMVQHPARLLTQGYAIAKTAEGNIAQSVTQFDPKDSAKATIQVLLQDGKLQATVTQVEQHPHTNLS